MTTRNFPLYDQLVQRAIETPVNLPDWEKYWRCGLTLPPSRLEVIGALVVTFKNRHGLPQGCIRSLPGNRGVSIDTERAPPELQQIIIAFLNQTLE